MRDFLDASSCCPLIMKDGNVDVTLICLKVCLSVSGPHTTVSRTTSQYHIYGSRLDEKGGYIIKFVWHVNDLLLERYRKTAWKGITGGLSRKWNIVSNLSEQFQGAGRQLLAINSNLSSALISTIVLLQELRRKAWRISSLKTKMILGVRFARLSGKKSLWKSLLLAQGTVH